MNSVLRAHLIRAICVAVLFLAFSAASVQSTKAAENPSKVIKACHSTWGKLGGKDLPHQGIHAHFIEAVFEKAGYRVETTITNWARCVDQVEKMNFDFTMAWESEKFRKIFEFFSFALKTPLNFVVLRESPLADGSIETMVGKSIGYLRNTGGLENYYAREDEFNSYPTGKVKVLFPMLLKGRIDAFIMDPTSLWDEINWLNSRFVGIVVESLSIRFGSQRDGSRALSGLVLACR